MCRGAHGNLFLPNMGIGGMSNFPYLMAKTQGHWKIVRKISDLYCKNVGKILYNRIHRKRKVCV